VGIYDALNVWNGVLFPLTLTQSPGRAVLPLALFNYEGQYAINVPAILAAVVLSLLPILALYAAARRPDRRNGKVKGDEDGHRNPRSRRQGVL
jgi:raffinose/stachyose/melibiose transport system permease protein